MPLIHVTDLPQHRREEAYGIVKLGSAYSEEEWLRCLQPDGGKHNGVLSASALNGVLLGIAAWNVGRRGEPGESVLRVPVFVAFELGGEKATEAALRGGLDQVGEKFGCGALMFGTDREE